MKELLIKLLEYVDGDSPQDGTLILMFNTAYYYELLTASEYCKITLFAASRCNVSVEINRIEWLKQEIDKL